MIHEKFVSSQSSSSMRVLSPFGHSLGQSMSIKLDADNYILWKSLLLPLVTGNNLDGILLGTVPCPDPVDPSTGTPNLQFLEWKSQDQVLLWWILNSLTPDMVRQVVGASATRRMKHRNAIASLCGATAQSEGSACRKNIQTATKGGKTMTEYRKRSKNMPIAWPPPDTDVRVGSSVMCTLLGLDPVFALTTVIERDASLHRRDMHASINFEAKLQQIQEVQSTSWHT
ncbi:hypothetical protein Sjap_023746 [Stephania japonica]|uniref:Retrotransposon Copia-like N-terminal domain-containing protein n=1 Tax=Stephania japonica TaxID=461633 RepID=A0AAP0HKT1_9MAGN